MPPTSWTSKWRMPSVRFIPSRAAANTSGSASQRRLDPRVLLLPAIRRELAATLEVGVVALVLGRLVGRGSLDQLGADPGDPFADRVIGQGFELGFEVVDLVDQRLNPAQLAVVGIDRSGEVAHGLRKYRVRGPASR